MLEAGASVEQHDARQALCSDDVVLANDVADVLDQVLVLTVEPVRTEVVTPVLVAVFDERGGHATDMGFAFEDGDVTRPRLAAGVALRGAMRMFFTYRGSLFWRMNAGMGDIVFAPLYEVLKQRGVRFEFFHRLVEMKVSPKREGVTPHVSALHFDVQAKVKQGQEYKPLVNVHDVPSWPSRPLYEQLLRGNQLEAEGRSFEGHWETRKAASKILKVTTDYDLVVLGVGVGALPYVASDLIEREPRWREMVEHVKTVPTQSFQLWLRRDMSQLGWIHPPVNLSGFVQPFDTWADIAVAALLSTRTSSSVGVRSIPMTKIVSINSPIM